MAKIRSFKARAAALLYSKKVIQQTNYLNVTPYNRAAYNDLLYRVLGM